MALEKLITKKGIEAGYHKITSANLSCKNDKVNLMIGLTSYVDEAYREKQSPVGSNFYNFVLENEEDFNVGIRELGYSKLKTLKEFEDAKDC